MPNKPSNIDRKQKMLLGTTKYEPFSASQKQDMAFIIKDLKSKGPLECLKMHEAMQQQKLGLQAFLEKSFKEILMMNKQISDLVIKNLKINDDTEQLFDQMIDLLKNRPEDLETFSDDDCASVIEDSIMMSPGSVREGGIVSASKGHMGSPEQPRVTMQSGLLHLNNLNSVYRETTHHGDTIPPDDEVFERGFDDDFDDDPLLQNAEFS